MLPAITTKPVTAEFCGRLLAAASAPLPPPVARAARRSLFNVLGTAIGAADSPAVEALLTAARHRGVSGEAVLPGRTETVDPYWGALVTGTAAHYDDFDDTHLATVIHPGAAALATVLSLQPETGLSGRRALSAFALGCEAQLRIGNAISPSHYDRGWHITGTCGVFGAAVAAAIVLGLDAGRTEQALALAATMTLGHREGFGSMTKPFHPGKAAANGVLAARLAASGQIGMADPFGPDGMLGVLAPEVDATRLGGSWNEDWELEQNAFKPYPCGIVAHPVIDAALGAAPRVDPAAITAVTIACHPLVPELMGRRDPADGLQARFSSYHAAAAGLLDGVVGLPQFTTGRARAADARALRELITLEPDSGCARDEATIVVAQRDSEPVTVHIEHARGSLARPLTDDELFAKVDALTEPILGAGRALAIRDAVDALDAVSSLDELLTAIRPAEEKRA
ncbi:MmgE/PrpD family protein [Amycolatopsis acidicola]|uniref:MmgE/PrpD family protein n=1 Tax=Amycolatopsis acidicola TaxID=2596893 RepID=A0A5N0ULZ8_9PSEU|nr:MmgE/PrpD family protein [Amycolatopsis acidicola]KAA9151055.1 MmgE/PrpD family protein [Amycolatopsis acidicola]